MGPFCFTPKKRNWKSSADDRDCRLEEEMSRENLFFFFYKDMMKNVITNMN